MTLIEIWSLVVGSWGITFGAGQIFEKTKTSKLEKFQEKINGTYIKKDLCKAYRDAEAQRWATVSATLEKLNNWVDRQKES
jgi:hypothetical protein